MYYSNSSPLSWQTNVLTFRNQSLKDVRQMLENRYGAEILMYHEMYRFHQTFSVGEEEVKPQDEIKLVLYLQYEPQSDQMLIRGLVKN
ncbi:MAG: hypothetical protein SF052_18500 [Bacteroidia bacterium]|nr:hypothetical protein [Bacteroidia bacterium]